MRSLKGEDFLILNYAPNLKRLARGLRSGMTEAELKLWSRLRRRQLQGVQFCRQRPVGPYIVDFYAPAVKLIVEVDGSQHSEPRGAAEDKIRDRFLIEHDLKVLRFDNLQVLKETDAVVTKIYNTILQRQDEM